MKKSLRKHAPPTFNTSPVPSWANSLKFPIPLHKEWFIRDATKVSEFIKCPRKDFLSNIYGWRQAEGNIHLVHGRGIHLMMDTLLSEGYNKVAYYKGLERYITEYRKTFLEEEDELYPGKNPYSASVIGEKYLERYQSDDFEVFATEQGGYVSINPNLNRNLYFRFDSILKIGGKFYVGEIKTTGWNFTSTWEAEWELRTQCLGYLYALHALMISKGYNVEDIGGIRIDGISCRSLKSGLVVDFKRVVVPYKPEMMFAWLAGINYWFDNWERELIKFSAASEDDLILNCFAQAGSQSGACTAYFRLCPFYDICLNHANPLKIYNRNPLGIEVNFWNPLEELEKTKLLELK